jgi:DNA-binding CsgD family transcriptional regulator
MEAQLWPQRSHDPSGKPARRQGEQVAFSEEEDEVMTFLRSEQESYYRGDFEAFIAHWHHGPEVRRIVSGPQVGTRAHTGWEEMRPRFEEGFRQFPQNFDAREVLRWDNIQIQVLGDMAWVTYDQVVTHPVPGLHAAPFSHETKIAQRIDGAWKLVCLIVVAPGVGREDVPLIELGSDGRVVSINALARVSLDKRASLVVSHGRPHARDRGFDPGLQAAIENCTMRLATNLPCGFEKEPASAVPLGENVSGQPIFCWITTEQERVLISFDDAFQLHAMLEKAAISFSLSPAQLRLAERLASGLELATAAADLGVSVNTVRTQLRRMFEKTGTHNQAALVSRLMNTLGPD